MMGSAQASLLVVVVVGTLVVVVAVVGILVVVVTVVWTLVVWWLRFMGG